MQATPDTAVPDPNNVQGNIAGFNKDHQGLVFLRFADQASGRAFIADIADDVATCSEAQLPASRCSTDPSASASSPAGERE